MALTKRRYSKEEFARRGDELYETRVRPNLKPDDAGKFAAVDIESGAYEIDEDELTAVDRLNARLADAQIWLVRVGSPYVHRFGGRKADPAMISGVVRANEARLPPLLRRSVCAGKALVAVSLPTVVYVCLTCTWAA